MVIQADILTFHIELVVALIKRTATRKVLLELF